MNYRKVLSTTFRGIAAATLGYGIYYDFAKVEVPVEFRAARQGFGGKLKYLTIWDVLLQFAFFFYCFVRDLLSFKISKSNSKTAKKPNKLMDTIFAALIFPMGNFVALTFWSIWAVDRELIFPAVFDAFYPPWLNHVMHTSIVPFDILELILVHHVFPSRGLGLTVLVLFMLTYLVWTFIIAYFGGFWVYAVLAYLDWGMRGLFILGCLTICIILYFAGEFCSYIVWGSTGTHSGKVTVTKQTIKIRKYSEKKIY